MKYKSLLVVTLAFASVSVGFADSKRTADYLRINPASHVDKKVTVDVTMVKPVSWKSPVDGISFFHASTLDRTDKKFGGVILVAVPSDEAEKFAKKYGTEYEGKNSRSALEGTFTLVSGNGPSGLWIIDTTGKIPQLVADKKLVIPHGDGNAKGFGGGRRPLRG
jgi:hypothetical protein